MTPYAHALYTPAGLPDYPQFYPRSQVKIPTGSALKGRSQRPHNQHKADGQGIDDSKPRPSAFFLKALTCRRYGTISNWNVS